ncbi:MAG: NeuD/PglB/VioB family sugar acetyltransferase [Bacteroidales bacterium]|nr:NeuD/PglB/VioB family sugar acetyltransferase [Bacteroidales bacterium]MBQ2913756.1 NeuD/PglB/VioB family sugar acetyltransferase [Bacteroidales bacterium]
MKHLLIIGARGWGREVYNFIPECIGYLTDFDVKGFLDDNVDVLQDFPGYPPVVDSVENYIPDVDDVFVCALGDAHWKKHYTDIVLSKGGEFVSLIHKTAIIQRNTQLGKGCIVCDNVGISCDIKLGDFITFQSYAIVGHDCRVGDYCHLGCRSFMGGFSELGDISSIQTNSIILPHIKVGKGCTVGAGSVVIKKVKDGDTVFGNPAKKLDF